MRSTTVSLRSIAEFLRPTAPALRSFAVRIQSTALAEQRTAAFLRKIALRMRSIAVFHRNSALQVRSFAEFDPRGAKFYPPIAEFHPCIAEILRCFVSEGRSSGCRVRSFASAHQCFAREEEPVPRECPSYDVRLPRVQGSLKRSDHCGATNPPDLNDLPCTCSLIPQRLDRIEVRCLIGGVAPEDDTDNGTYHEADDRPIDWECWRDFQHIDCQGVCTAHAERHP